MKTNNYFLIDYGNTNIKAGICKNNQITKIEFIHKDSKPETLLNKFNKSDFAGISKIFVCSTVSEVKLNSFLKAINKYLKLKIKIIERKDFNGLLNFSNVNKKVVVANDLLLLGLYASAYLPKGAIFCLGTVYSSVVMNGNKFKSTLFIPSITKAINDISKVSSIPSKDIPSIYDKNIGLNTYDCISSGANLLLEGFIDNVVKTYDLNPNNVVITGGDANQYINACNKYKVIDNLTLRALALLVNKKNW